MKKIILTIIVGVLSIVIAIFLTIIIFLVFFNNFYKKSNNGFNYYSIKEDTIKYLEDNEDILNEIVEKLYENKSSIKNPTKEIRLAKYNYLSDFNFKEKTEFIEFSIYNSGLFGGQDYGLIYSKINSENIIIYDEKEAIGEGNNIFIREKIYENWYFYYNDWDGEVDAFKINKNN